MHLQLYCALPVCAVLGAAGPGHYDCGLRRLQRCCEARLLFPVLPITLVCSAKLSRIIHGNDERYCRLSQFFTL